MNADDSILLADLEAAINWWRERSPSPDGITACAEVRALAEVYAGLVYFRRAEVAVAQMPEMALQAWLAWYDSTPDTPCIAICSTAQGDIVCKGCGRTEDEVQHWTALSPAHKRAVWHRITQAHSAWRFNRYAERARDATRAPTSAADTMPSPSAAAAATNNPLA
jgi:predicted Fe-S protein YdhL (DUF1289 family)